MLLFAQTDPAWEYWDTSTYVAIAITFTLIATLAAWLVLRYWRKVNGPERRRTN
jgi:H+/Cl- antiporter ClcA